MVGAIVFALVSLQGAVSNTDTIFNSNFKGFGPYSRTGPLVA
jgi:hypothetical protein